MIRQYQAEGRLVAMTGDGTDDTTGAGASRCRGGDELRVFRRRKKRQYGQYRL
ncbi:hypothetical protein ACLB1R_15685 [Escherichia coli]